MKRVFSHIGFSAAVTLIVLNLIDTEYVLIISAGLAVLFAASLFIKKYRQALTVPICVGSALFACLIFLSVYNLTVVPELQLDGKSADVSFYIISVPEQTESGYTYTVKTTEIGMDGAVQNIKAKMNTDQKLNVDAYRIVNAKAEFRSISDNAYSSFGYWGDNVFLSLNADNISVTNIVVKSPWSRVLQLRADIIESLTKNISGDSGALSAAMITGSRYMLSDKSYNNFKICGATHLMAVSGMHLTVVTGFLLFILKRLKLNDKLCASIAIFEILFYCGIAGFSKSVIRAGIMMITMLLGNLINKRSDAMNSLGLAVFIICLNPFAVCDIGAVLSVLSVLALITIYPYFVKKLGIVVDDGMEFITEFSYSRLSSLISSFFVSLSIMIYSLPVMYIFFGYVSIIGLVANIVLVPLGSLLMIVSLFTYNLSGLGFLGDLSADLCGFISSLILKIVNFFASFDGSTISLSDSFGVVIAGALVLAAFGFMSASKKTVKVTAVISCVAVMLSLVVLSNSNNKKSEIFICENSAVVMSYNGKSVVFGLDNYEDYYSVYQYLFANTKQIECLISCNDNTYNKKLIENISCKNFILSEFDDDIMSSGNCDNVIVCSSYEADLCDDFKIECSFDEEWNINADINSSLFSDMSNSNADIVLGKNYVKDVRGKINLSQGDIIYTLSKGKAFSVRRDNWWLK